MANYNFKFINADNIDEKQTALNDFLFNEGWRARGCEPEELTEEMAETIIFLVMSDWDIDYKTVMKWELIKWYIQYMIEYFVNSDEEGESATDILEWANLYADFWGVE